MRLFVMVLSVLMLSTAAWAQSPQLTEAQKLKVEALNLHAALQTKELEILRLRIELAQALQLAMPAIEKQANDQFQQRLKELQDEIHAAHPDWEWDSNTGAFSPRPKPEQKD